MRGLSAASSVETALRLQMALCKLALRRWFLCASELCASGSVQVGSFAVFGTSVRNTLSSAGVLRGSVSSM